MKTNILILLVISSTIFCLSQTALAQKSVSNIIYIDPAFDNDQLGPAIKQKDKAEKIVLDIANKLSDQLKKGGSVVNIARTNISLEDRLEEAEEQHSSLYISISLSKADKNCIRILYPKFEKKVHRQDKDADKTISDETYNMLGNSAKENISAESKTVANLILKNINQYSIKNCVKVNASSSYLLRLLHLQLLSLNFKYQVSITYLLILLERSIYVKLTPLSV